MREELDRTVYRLVATEELSSGVEELVNATELVEVTETAAEVKEELDGTVCKLVSTEVLSKRVEGPVEVST